MGARSGTLTFTRFFTQGALPRDLRRRFLEAARLRVFQPLKPEDEALEASGWCVMERPFDLELDSAKMFQERLSEAWKLGWEPAIVSWADDDAVPSDVLARLVNRPRARLNKAKHR